MEANSLSARLSTLPVKEHAILLNRFKFLDLVQRVAAADVEEMVQTVGLEALSYKGALEKIPIPYATAVNVEKPTGSEKDTPSRTFQPHRYHTRTANGSTTTPSRRPKRFETRERELQFINRISQPQKRRDPLAFQLRKPPRGGYREEGHTQPPRELPSAALIGGYSDGRGRGGTAPVVVPQPWKNAKRRYEYNGSEDYDNDNDEDYDDDDVVVVADSDDGGSASGAGRPRVRVVVPHAARGGGRRRHVQSPQSQRIGVPPPPPRDTSAYPGSAKEAFVPLNEVGSRVVTGEMQGSPKVQDSNKDLLSGEYERVPQAQGNQQQEEQQEQEQQLDSSQAPMMELMTPRTMQNVVARHRGHLAPKAKPKATAGVPRVPMEIIRHASALLSSRNVTSPLPPHGSQGPQQQQPIPAHNVVLDVPSVQFPSGMSQSHSQPPPASRSARKGDFDIQRGQTPTSARTRTLSDDALTELTSTVERMLEDHRAVLDNIMKERDYQPPSEREAHAKRLDKGGICNVVTSESADNVSKNTPRNIEKNTPLDTLGENESARILQQAHDALENFSDEEDELLLVSRLQRQVSLMDREMEAIEQREGNRVQRQGGLTKEEKEELDYDDGGDGKVLHRTESSGQSGRRVVIVDAKKALSGRDDDSGQGSRRFRRGEMSRVIVDRLRSFQKENHDYIRFTEKQWNTSHVTEQVFAQRLTETLAEDAFQEVFEEVGSILDTYVEGLMLHELQ